MIVSDHAQAKRIGNPFDVKRERVRHSCGVCYDSSGAWLTRHTTWRSRRIFTSLTAIINATGCLLLLLSVIYFLSVFIAYSALFFPPKSRFSPKNQWELGKRESKSTKCSKKSDSSGYLGGKVKWKKWMVFCVQIEAGIFLANLENEDHCNDYWWVLIAVKLEKTRFSGQEFQPKAVSHALLHGARQMH